MSNSSRRLSSLLIPSLNAAYRRSRLGPPMIYAPTLYIASLTMGTGPRLLLVQIVDRVLRGRPFTPSEDRLAEMLHRHPRTVRRWARVLVQRGWVAVIRRGRKRTNVYRVTPAFWARLAKHGRRQVPKPPWLVQLDLLMQKRFADNAAPAPAADKRR